MKKVVFDALQSRCKQFATEFPLAKKGGYDVTGRLQQIEQIEKPGQIGKESFVILYEILEDYYVVDAQVA